eukprot:4283273-Karenia_brevis.AAC.1
MALRSWLPSWWGSSVADAPRDLRQLSMTPGMFICSRTHDRPWSENLVVAVTASRSLFIVADIN